MSSIYIFVKIRAQYGLHVVLCSLNLSCTLTSMMSACLVTDTISMMNWEIMLFTVLEMNRFAVHSFNNGLIFKAMLPFVVAMYHKITCCITRLKVKNYSSC